MSIAIKLALLFLNFEKFKVSDQIPWFFIASSISKTKRQVRHLAPFGELQPEYQLPQF